jgi:hypothetical protein
MRRWVGLGLFAVGVAGCALLLQRIGIAPVLASLLRARSWLPWLLLLETGRVAAETLATYFVLGRAAHGVPLRELWRAQLTCSALATVLPAGRSAGEAAKASLLAARVGVPVALSAGAGGQIVNLLANGVVGIVGGIAVLQRVGTCAIGTSCFGYGSGLLLLGLLLAWAARSRALAARLERLPIAKGRIERFSVAVRESGALSIGAISGQLLARVCQALQLVALAHAFGHVLGLGSAPLLLAVYMLGATAGDLIPAQLGAVDAAFVFGAGLLGMPEASAVGIALSLHALQLASAALCTLCAAALARASLPLATLKSRSTAWEN